MKSLANKNILITGGAGFIGSHIADIAVQEGGIVTCYDNLCRGSLNNIAHLLDKNGDQFRFVHADVRDNMKLEESVSKADVVFHQSALRITACAEHKELAFETMGRAFFDLLELCVKYKTERLVVASSASVYGLAETFPTPETCHNYDNKTLYGALKIFNEALLRSYHDMHGLNYVATRNFNVFGPRMDTEGKYTEVLVRWMERIEDGLGPIIYGDGNQTMDFVDVRDVARANILAAKSESTDEVFNVASGTETSLVDLAYTLLDVMGRSDLEVVHEAERAVNPVPRRLADISKADAVLGFKSEIDLKCALQELVEWWRSVKLAA